MKSRASRLFFALRLIFAKFYLILLYMRLQFVFLATRKSKIKNIEVFMDIKKLLSKMTTEEKVLQLLQINSVFFKDDTGSEATGPRAKFNISEHQVFAAGSLLNFMGASVMIELQNEYLARSEKKIPLLFMQDIIHGYRTIFPIPLGLGASFDAELVKECSAMAAKEAAVGGVHVTFTPMVDTARDARWGRVMETTGEDQWLNGIMGAATIEGFKRGGDEYGLVTCVKHYAAYGAAEAGRDYNTVDMSERTAREYYLPAYKACVDAGVDMVMTSFNVFDGIPAAANKKLVRDILKDEWGFDGIVISDYAALNEMIAHGYAKDLKEAALRAAEAGVDIEMMSMAYPRYLQELISEGKIDMAWLDAAVEKVLKLKDKLGLFENPYRKASVEESERFLLCSEHRELARRAAEDSAVLLENDGILPLDKSKLKRIAIIGPLADTGEILGSWKGGGKESETVTIADGIKAYCGDNVKIEVAAGCSAALDSKDEGGFKSAVRAAKKADVVIMCLGEHQGDSGEGKSKMDIELPAIQYKLLDAVKKANNNIVVLLFTGRPLALPRLKKEVRAVLNMWFPGTEGGNAAANLLFGEVNPSGKLTMSFPYHVGQCPIYYNHYSTGRPRKSDERRCDYQSSYMDGPNAPLYPFGYGKSYTEFAYSPITLSSDTLDEESELTAEVTVKNIGHMAGKEVVQLYIHDLYGSTVRPVKELKGYKKIFLEPGEEKKVTFTVNADMLAFYGADLRRKAEKGEFELFIGPSSAVCDCVKFELV